MGNQYVCGSNIKLVALRFIVASCLFGSAIGQSGRTSGTYGGGGNIPRTQSFTSTNNLWSPSQADDRRSPQESLFVIPRQPPTPINSVLQIRMPGMNDAPRYPEAGGGGHNFGGRNPQLPPGIPFPSPPIVNSGFDSCTTAVRNYSVDMQDLALREAYAKACLENKLPDGLADIDLASAGIRVVGSAKPFCSGVIIRPGVFLTARHCFFNPGNGTKRYEWELLEQGKLEVVSGLARAHKLACAATDQDRKTPAVTLCSARSARTGFDIDEDKIVLNIPSLGNEFQGMRVGSPTAGSELLVYSFFEALEKRHFSKFACKLTSVKGKCALHVCQASHSSSGGPLIFKNAQNEMLVGGIHIGKAEESASCGLQGGEQVNVGVLVSE